jgi:hypothetical protein
MMHIDEKFTWQNVESVVPEHRLTGTDTHVLSPTMKSRIISEAVPQETESTQRKRKRIARNISRA